MAKKLISILGFKADELIREDGYRPTISVSMDLRSDVDLSGTRIVAQFWDGDPELTGTSTIIVQPEMVSPYNFEKPRPAEYKSGGVDITGPGNLLYTSSGEAIPGRGDLIDIVGDYTWHRLTLEGIEVPKFSGGNPAVYIEIFYAFVSKASGGSNINARRWMLNRGNKCAPYNPSGSLIGGATNITEYYVIPEQFGAVGNGDTDDTAAVQAALNTGREVRLPRGRAYGITDTLTVGVTGTRVTGYGTLRINDGFLDSGQTDKTLLNVTADRVLLKSFSINHNNIPSTGILLNGSNRTQIEEMRFFNLKDGSGYTMGSSNSAIKVQGDENFIRHCYFHDFACSVASSAPRCISVQGGSQRTTISDCQSVIATHGGITVGASNETYIRNCVFHNLSDNGLYILANAHNLFVNNVSVSITEEPIVIAGYNVFIDGLTILNGGNNVGGGSIGLEKGNNIYLTNVIQSYDGNNLEAKPILRTRSGNRHPDEDDSGSTWASSRMSYYLFDSNGDNYFTSTNNLFPTTYVNSTTFKITGIDCTVMFWANRRIGIEQSSSWSNAEVAGSYFDGNDTYVELSSGTIANANIEGLAGCGVGKVVLNSWDMHVPFGRGAFLEDSGINPRSNALLLAHFNGTIDSLTIDSCILHGYVNGYSTYETSEQNYYFIETKDYSTWNVSPDFITSLNGFLFECRILNSEFIAENKSNYDLSSCIFRVSLPGTTKYAYDNYPKQYRSIWCNSLIDTSKTIGANNSTPASARVMGVISPHVITIDDYGYLQTTSNYINHPPGGDWIIKEVRAAAKPTYDSDFGLGSIVKNINPSDGDPAMWIYTEDNPAGLKQTAPVGGSVVTAGLAGTGFSSDPITFEKTQAEIDANVTIVNGTYEVGSVNRYGAVGDGSTDDRDAVIAALKVIHRQGGGKLKFEPGYDYVISSGFPLISFLGPDYLGNHPDVYSNSLYAGSNAKLTKSLIIEAYGARIFYQGSDNLFYFQGAPTVTIESGESQRSLAVLGGRWVGTSNTIAMFKLRDGSRTKFDIEAIEGCEPTSGGSDSNGIPQKGIGIFLHNWYYWTENVTITGNPAEFINNQCDIMCLDYAAYSAWSGETLSPAPTYQSFARTRIYNCFKGSQIDDNRFLYSDCNFYHSFVEKIAGNVSNLATDRLIDFRGNAGSTVIRDIKFEGADDVSGAYVPCYAIYYDVPSGEQFDVVPFVQNVTWLRLDRDGTIVGKAVNEEFDTRSGTYEFYNPIDVYGLGGKSTIYGQLGVESENPLVVHRTTDLTVNRTFQRVVDASGESDNILWDRRIYTNNSIAWRRQNAPSPALEDEEVMVLNHSNGRVDFKYVPLIEGQILNLEHLYDVEFESPHPQVNDVLKFDGTYWRADTVSAASITGFLTRETYVTNTNAEGSGYNLTYAGGEFRVFDGNTEVTGDSPVTYSIIGDS